MFTSAEKQLQSLRDEVRALLNLMKQLDPTGGRERHPEWPLQLRGDQDEVLAVRLSLNRLERLTK
jgi:hypothetical protein